MTQAPLFRPKAQWRAPRLSELPSWRGAKRVGYDVETVDPSLKALGPGVRRDGRVVGVSFAIEDGPSHYLPVGHQGGDNLSPEKVWEYLRDQAAEYDGLLVGANLQYDLDYSAENGVWFSKAKRFRDVQIAEPLIDENQFSYSLDRIAKHYGLPSKDERLLRDAAEAWGVHPKIDMWRLPARYVGDYACWDAELPLKILRRQERIIDEQDLWQIFDLESAVLPVLVKMRRRGVAVDTDRLEKVEQWADAQGEEYLRRVYDETGVRLTMANMNDSDAVAKPLLHLGVELEKGKNGKYSVDADLLKSIESPVGEWLNEAKQMNNVRVKFGNGIRKHLVNGRIHSTFNQLRVNKDENNPDDGKGARYGRLSSSEPNMQQQPSRHKEIASRWRSIYVPDGDGLWAMLDYSQQEPRWLVHYAELCKLPKARQAAEQYRTDPTTDNHDMMTALIHGQDIKERVDGDKFKQLRGFCKTIFLGKCYGMGGGKLCHKLGLPTKWIYSKKFDKMIEVAGPEGEAILRKFDSQLPFVKGLARVAEKRADEVGYILTVLGRRCRFPEKDNGEYDWTHKALNRLIQGSSADQTKAALVQLDEAGEEPQLQVHDEIDMTVVDRAHAERCADVMRNCVPANLPFKVDVEIGPSWGEAA